jgi:hypothetical protein
VSLLKHNIGDSIIAQILNGKKKCYLKAVLVIPRQQVLLLHWLWQAHPSEMPVISPSLQLSLWAVDHWLILGPWLKP